MNQVARLVRGASTPQGTFGLITVGNKSWHTVERPWADNASNVSCIPKGSYACRMTFSPRFRTMTYELADVPGGRFAVRIHPANLAKQLNGCIALGEKLGTMDGVPCVLVSRPAVKAFEAALGRAPFTLEIV